ncbi:hypothetical protein F383_14026 [Gossypium arboreum]|uniref:Uncharacterized protein n=1 Tax=Gossypium arboreum TaxID=29729 RepID=A0A0B0NED7_GOSAR|nr:hypothetical protein F383_14026 [Gossypium arboreum]
MSGTCISYETYECQCKTCLGHALASRRKPV